MIISKDNIRDFKNYIEFDSFEKFGLKIISTKKEYGNILEKSKETILKDFNIENKVLISGHQTHSDNVKFIKDLSINHFENTDGLLANNKNAALLVKFADCLPIFIYDEENSIFGAIHSGWQGTYKEITIKAIQNILKNSDISKINILLGVGISCKNYEVQEDFYLKFKNKFPQNIVDLSFKKFENKLFFDNQYFNYLSLKNIGISEDKIFMNNLCTFEGENFHSYRRDKELSGRNGGIIFKI